jgi:hypothetical protein
MHLDWKCGHSNRIWHKLEAVLSITTMHSMKYTDSYFSNISVLEIVIMWNISLRRLETTHVINEERIEMYIIKTRRSEVEYDNQLPLGSS